MKSHGCLHGFRLVFGATVLSLLVAGCAAVDTNGSGLLELPDQAATSQSLGSPGNGQSFTMEIRPAGKKKAEIRHMPLTGLTHVQQALEQSGAVKRFRRMDIRVMRAAGDERHRLEVKYDRSAASVAPLYDYAIHPGDHIVVIEDTTTALGEMLQSMLGSMGRIGGK